MNSKVLRICNLNINSGCRRICQLSDACKRSPGESKAVYAARMNEAAEGVSMSDFRKG